MLPASAVTLVAVAAKDLARLAEFTLFDGHPRPHAVSVAGGADESNLHIGGWL